MNYEIKNTFKTKNVDVEVALYITYGVNFYDGKYWNEYSSRLEVTNYSNKNISNKINWSYKIGDNVKQSGVYNNNIIIGGVAEIGYSSGNVYPNTYGEANNVPISITFSSDGNGIGSNTFSYKVNFRKIDGAVIFKNLTSANKNLDTTNTFTVVALPKKQNMAYSIVFGSNNSSVLVEEFLGYKNEEFSYSKSLSYQELYSLLTNDYNSNDKAKIGFMVKSYTDDTYNELVETSGFLDIEVDIPNEIHNGSETISLLPTFDANLVKINGELNDWTNIFLENLTIGKATIDNIETKLNANVKKVSISDGTTTYNDFVGNFGTYKKESSLNLKTITYTLVDSRNKTLEKKFQFVVEDYEKPRIYLEAKRCNSSGNPTNNGGYLLVDIITYISFVGGNNKIKNGSVSIDGTQVDTITSDENYHKVLGDGNVTLDKSHYVSVSIEDEVSKNSVYVDISVATTPFNILHDSGNGRDYVGIGGYVNKNFDITFGSRKIGFNDLNSYDYVVLPTYDDYHRKIRFVDHLGEERYVQKEDVPFFFSSETMPTGDYWFGKPIYCTTLALNNIRIDRGTSYFINHEIYDIDMIIKVDAFMWDSSTNKYSPYPNMDETTGTTAIKLIGLKCTRTQLQFWGNTYWTANANRTHYFTIYHTMIEEENID